jgi:hypothetical protein
MSISLHGRAIARNQNAAPAVALREVRKVHGQDEAAVVALDGISVGLSSASFTAIMGPSGSGKSTFLHVAAGLDRPTSGTVALGGTNLAKLSERRLTILRRERIGFVFQSFNLMPSLTVTQNIGLPLRLDGRRVRRSEVREVAARVGWRSASVTGLLSSRAASNSGSRSPGRWSPGLRWCSLTSQRVHWTPSPGGACLRSFARSSMVTATRWSWSPTIRRRRHMPTGSSCSPTDGSRGSSRLRVPTRSPSTWLIWGAERCCVSPFSVLAAASVRSPVP